MIPGLSIRNARGFSLTLKADKARVTPGKGATFAGLKLTTGNRLMSTFEELFLIPLGGSYLW